MNKDQKSLIQDCISELNLQIEYFKKIKIYLFLLEKLGLIELMKC